MLKIYLCTVHYELHSGDKKCQLGTWDYFVIADENHVSTHTKMWSAYSEDAAKVYGGGCHIYEKKKGRTARYTLLSDFMRDATLKEWEEPNAQLVAHISYKERACSMKHLMTLPATDVIAYLKQEGLNLVMPS